MKGYQNSRLSGSGYQDNRISGNNTILISQYSVILHPDYLISWYPSSGEINVPLR